MKSERVWKMYWSATGTTKTVVSAIADRLAAELGLPVETYDFTLPAGRRGAPPGPHGNPPPGAPPRIGWPDPGVSHDAGTQARFRWNATMVKS